MFKGVLVHSNNNYAQIPQLPLNIEMHNAATVVIWSEEIFLVSKLSKSTSHSVFNKFLVIDV